MSALTSASERHDRQAGHGLSVAEQFEIEQILRAATGSLVGLEVCSAEHRYLNPLDVHHDAPRPGLGELHTRNAGEDIHTAGDDANLKDRIVFREIVQREICERRAVRFQSG